MPRDAEGRLVSPWNLVQAVLGDEIKQQRHCVADLSLYEFLRQRLTERNLPARVYISVQKPLYIRPKTTPRAWGSPEIERYCSETK
jgi:hypothetical protein